MGLSTANSPSRRSLLADSMITRSLGSLMEDSQRPPSRRSLFENSRRPDSMKNLTDRQRIAVRGSFIVPRDSTEDTQKPSTNTSSRRTSQVDSNKIPAFAKRGSCAQRESLKLASRIDK